MKRLIPFVIIIILAFIIKIFPPGPDANLYFGLGNNLLNGFGYIDNIRNDEIIPAIGYPLVIMFALKYGISGEVFTITLLIISLLLLFEVMKNLKISPIISIIIIFLFVKTLPPLNIWGIEVMLIFSAVLLFYSLTLFINSQNFTNLLFVSFALLLSVLTRPILMPFLYLILPLILYYIFKKEYLRKTLFICLILFVTFLILISYLSNSKYNDNRYLSGTYSGFALYPVWNNYLNLQKSYYSTNWNKLPQNIKEEAIEPFKNITGWKDRDKLLKEKSFQFLLEEPEKALKGYVWRISKYTYNADSYMYIILFYVWIFLIMVNLFYIKFYSTKNKTLFLFSFILTSYIILITSLFVYVDTRYLITPGVYLIFSIAILIYIFKNKRSSDVSTKKNILFISANDFKEKSIQVIRKTPEAYSQKDWNVIYLVARDNSRTGNYFYEKEINPAGITVIRFEMPFTKIKDFFKNHSIKTIISKLIGFITIFLLFIKAIKLIKKNDIKVLYGYEIHGVLASFLCKLIYKKKLIYIHRFMGTWLTSYYNQRKKLKLFLNFDAIFALKLNSDLLIMTNDGTQGNKALKIFNSKSLKNYRFWINGVDEQKLPVEKNVEFKNQLGLKDEIIFLSISRLNSWKRVDRVINILSLIKKENFKYFIVGDGELKDKLKKLVEEKNLIKKVIFVGSISNYEVKKYLNIADVFFSFYDLSNVGNPLLEAIRANKIIFTLNNGDTKDWIKHKENGFIYDVDNNLYGNIARDLNGLIKDDNLKEKIICNIKKTEREKLWTWEERMNTEVLEVEKLLNDN